MTFMSLMNVCNFLTTTVSLLEVVLHFSHSAIWWFEHTFPWGIKHTISRSHNTRGWRAGHEKDWPGQKHTDGHEAQSGTLGARPNKLW